MVHGASHHRAPSCTIVAKAIRSRGRGRGRGRLYCTTVLLYKRARSASRARRQDMISEFEVV